ncbi:MAG: LysR family transcriptional regulator [Chloroflexota bacterium]|nr:LysR family transcriptional regulator [Chloroflexota bacterium]
MNLDYLRTYLQVIELGSFSEVAKKLLISQPAVSFQIQKLERDLGVRLIDRGQKTIVMTDAGKRLMRFAQVVDKERDHLLRDLDQLREEVTGNLVVAASTIPGEILLPPLLGEFRTLHPAVGIRVEVSDSLNVIDGVREGTYELGFCGTMPEGSELDHFKIAEDEIVLIVFPAHPFAQQGEISLLDLEAEPIILREETSGTQQSLKRFLDDGGFGLRIGPANLVLSTTQAVVSAVEAQVGIAFVSNLAIKRSLTLGLVKEVAIEGLKLRREFYCIYRKERIVSRLLSECIAFLRARSPLG